MQRHAQPPRQLPGGQHHQPGLGRAKGRRAGFHRHGRGETAHQARRAGGNQLDEGEGRQSLRQHLRQRARDCGWGHGAGQHPGRAGDGLAGLRIGFQSARHVRVHHQRRVGVGDAVEDGGLGDVRAPEQDTRHVDGVARTLRPDKGAHERPVRMADMGVEHIEMALVGGQVDRLTHHAPGMMQPWQSVVEFDEGLEVFVTRITSPPILIMDKGRPPRGAEDRRIAAKLHIIPWIAGVLGKLARGSGLNGLTAETGGEADAGFVYVAARISEDLKNFGIALKLHSRLSQDRLSVGLDQRQTLIS